MKITKDTTLKEILELDNAQEVLAKHNIPCITCPFAKMEMENLNLGDICKNYNIEIEGLLKDLQKIKKK